jgi:hypothetical protein
MDYRETQFDVTEVTLPFVTAWPSEDRNGEQALFMEVAPTTHEDLV